MNNECQSAPQLGLPALTPAAAAPPNGAETLVAKKHHAANRHFDPIEAGFFDAGDEQHGEESEARDDFRDLEPGEAATARSVRRRLWTGLGICGGCALLLAVGAGFRNEKPEPASMATALAAEPAATPAPAPAETPTPIQAAATPLPTAPAAVPSAPPAPVAAEPAPTAPTPTATAPASAAAVPAPAAAPTPVAAEPAPTAAPAPVAAVPAPAPAAEAVAAAPIPAPPSESAKAPNPVAVVAQPEATKPAVAPAQEPAAPALAKADKPGVPAATDAPSADELGQRCLQLSKQHKLKDVVDVCGRAFAAGAATAEVAVSIARAEFDRGRGSQAVVWARRAIERNADTADAYVYVGMAEQESGHRAAAKAAYQHYLQLAPKGRYASDLRSVVNAL